MLVLIQSFASGVFALAGVALLWLLQRKNRSDDQEEKQREVLRVKAEELYVELQSVEGGCATSISGASQWMQREEGEGGPIATPAVGRLRGLVAIYFPSGKHIFEDFDQKVASHGLMVRAQLTANQGTAPPTNSIKGATWGYLLLISQETLALVSNLRAFMDVQAADLF